MSDDRVYRYVRQVLLKEWDPCNVGANDALSDEYDSYVTTIVSLMAQPASAEVLSAALSEMETELGVSLREGRREVAVKALLALPR
jgi:hypothetical protein